MNIPSKSKNLLFVISFLIYLIPIALVSGPFLPDLFVSLIVILFITLTFLERDFNFYKNSYFKIFILWWAYLTIRSLFSIDPLLSLESSLFYFRFGFFSIAVWYCVEKNLEFINYFRLSLTLTITFVALDALLQYFSGYNILGIPYNGLRLNGFFDDELILGSYLVRLLPLFVFLFLVKENLSSSEVLLLLIMLPLISVLIFLSGERTAFFILLLILIGYFVLLNGFLKIRILFLISSLVLIFLIGFLDTSTKQRVVDNTINQSNLFKGDKEFVIFSERHQYELTIAKRIFLDNSIFGSGTKTYRVVCDDEKYKYDLKLPKHKSRCSNHPHNIYAQLFSETGILGTIPICALFFLTLFIFFKQLAAKISLINYNIKNYQLSILLSIFIYLFPLVPSVSFFNNWFSIISFLPIGFMLSAFYRIKK